MFFYIPGLLVTTPSDNGVGLLGFDQPTLIQGIMVASKCGGKQCEGVLLFAWTHLRTFSHNQYKYEFKTVQVWAANCETTWN